MARRVSGSNHITYGEPALIRLTTDAPLSYIENETPFALTRPLHLIFGPDEPFAGEPAATVRDFERRTRAYWQEWVRRLSIAYEWQEATIRAAITLKLSSFEETGGIVAALTTSLPESPHSGRNWDYRYCWPRDAYFVVKALNRIGATRTMEDYIDFILSIAGEDDTLKPCYGIVPNADLTEWIAPHLNGFQNHGPVRFGNAAVSQVQHDAYGSVILSAVPMFFDRRLPSPGGEPLFGLIEKLARQMRRPGAQARCRHLGISRPRPHPHPQRGDVLGGPVARRRHRQPAGTDRSRRPLERHRRQGRQGDSGALLE